MSFLTRKDSNKAATTPPPIKKYNYKQYLETQAPSDAVLNTASKYGDKVASSAALQADIEANAKMSPRSRPKRRRVCTPGRVTFILLCVLQMCGAAAVIGVTAGCLDTNVTSADGTTSKEYCYLLNSSVNTCTYAYWAGGASIALSIVLMLFNLACAGKRGMCCLSVEAILACCGVIWWIAAGVVSVITSDNASDQGLEKKSCREALYIASFCTAGLFLAQFLLSTTGCCCSCCRETDDDY